MEAPPADRNLTVSPRRKRFLIGLAFGSAGAVAAAAAAATSTMPPLLLWCFFGAAYVALSFFAVEVNDRFLASSSIMPVMTAGIVFAVESGSAVLGMVLMGVLGGPSLRDLRERRLVQPVVNSGQLALSALLAGGTIDLILAVAERAGLGHSVGVLALAAGAGAVVYSTVNNPLVRIAVRLFYGTRTLQPWAGMLGIATSEGAMGMLGGLLGAVLLRTSVSVVPLIIVVYISAHLAFVSQARVREAQESTLKAFVKSLETRDLYTRGHTERVAYFSRLIAEQLHLSADRQARLRVAALIHDMGKLAVPVELIRKASGLSDDEYRVFRTASHAVDDLLSEVDFLRPMVEIASGCHTRLTGEDFGQTGHTHTLSPSVDQQILAVADTFDAMTSVRGYRMARSQDEAIALLGSEAHAIYGRAAVDALQRGLAAVGERYGPAKLLDHTSGGVRG